VTPPIVEDFAAIRARLEAIRAAERPVPVPAGAAAPPAEPARDVPAWLLRGRLWADS
jgi:hypothetical protein